MAGSPCPFPTNQPGRSGQLSAGSTAESVILKPTHGAHPVSQTDPSRAFSTSEPPVCEPVCGLQVCESGERWHHTYAGSTTQFWGADRRPGCSHILSPLGDPGQCAQSSGLYHERKGLGPFLVWTGQLGCLLCTPWIAFPTEHVVLRVTLPQWVTLS